jgi:hypothetical protein
MQQLPLLIEPAKRGDFAVRIQFPKQVKALEEKLPDHLRMTFRRSKDPFGSEQQCLTSLK